MKNVLIIFLLFYSTILNKVYSQWSDVQQGTNRAIEVFYVDSMSNLLFVGGQFSEAGGLNINNIATWDGNVWNAFGNNEVFSSPGAVSAIVNYNGSIIVGGEFDSIGLKPVNNVAKWNGAGWENMGDGFDGSVEDLIVYNDDLYACGFFSYSGSDFVECFAKWNGTNWERVSKLIGYANSFAKFNGELIVAGAFEHESSSSIKSIIGWNGIEIDTIFGYFNNAVISIRNYNDTLYAVGSFTSNLINPSNFISLFYNQSWHSIGNPSGGLNWITDVLKYNNVLYLCGYFTYPPDLGKFNGLNFDSVADVFGFLKVLIEYKGKLYVGGAFSKLNGQSISNIAKYNDLGNFVFKNNIGNGSVNVFPNPNHDGKFNLDLDIEKYVGKIKITIYSFDGNTIYSYESKVTSSNNFEINILPVSGAYYLKCEINNSMILVKKIIVL